METKRLSLRPYAKAPELDLRSMTGRPDLRSPDRQYLADIGKLIWAELDAKAA